MEPLDPAEPSPRGPERALADALSHALREGFPERAETALHLAELFLDAGEVSVALTRGADAAEALSAVELFATRADVFAWDGPPGWDEVLARGLVQRRPLPAGPSVLDGLSAVRDRAALRDAAVARAREEAARFLERGRAAAALRDATSAAEAVVAAHASLLRLIGAAAAASTLLAPEEAAAGGIGAPSLAPLFAEMDARAQAGSEFAAAQDEWLARLAAQNAPAAEPAFRTFFAGLSQVPRTALALRVVRDEARAGAISASPEAVLGAVGGWQPVRWAALRRGARPEWLTELCPPAPASEAPLARLARECDAALDLAGRLWFAKDFSLAAFTTLSALFTARCASVLALWEELG